jgi:hypothetical protein
MSPMGAIEMSALGQAMRQWLWLYPAVETVHIVGIALLFGSIAVLDLRLIGFSRSLPLRRLAGHVLPWTIGSFVLIVPSGLAMFVAHATELIQSPVFVLKLSLIFAAAINAALYHAAAGGERARWDVDAMPPALARISGAVSLLLWIAVIACGRLLAYV